MIQQTVTNSFLGELLRKIHDFSADTFKMALYDYTATLDADTTVYITTGEITGPGYTAGGADLTGVGVVDGNPAYITFDDATWAGALTARGALIYNSTQANRTVAVLDFGADRTSTTTFTVQMPGNTSTTALLRLYSGV